MGLCLGVDVWACHGAHGWNDAQNSSTSMGETTASAVPFSPESSTIIHPPDPPSQPLHYGHSSNPPPSKRWFIKRQQPLVRKRHEHQRKGHKSNHTIPTTFVLHPFSESKARSKSICHPFQHIPSSQPSSHANFSAPCPWAPCFGTSVAPPVPASPRSPRNSSPPSRGLWPTAACRPSSWKLWRSTEIPCTSYTLYKFLWYIEEREREMIYCVIVSTYIYIYYRYIYIYR